MSGMSWVETLLAEPPGEMPADAVPRVVTFVRQCEKRLESDLAMLRHLGEATVAKIREKERAFDAALAPALRLLGRVATPEALQTFVMFLSDERSLIRTAALDALPADMPDAWWEVLAPIAIERRRYAFVAARPAGRQALLAVFQRAAARRRDLLDALRTYLDSDPAVFDGIAADEFVVRFAHCDVAAYRTAAATASSIGAAPLAAAFDDAVAAAEAEEAFGPEYSHVVSSDAYGPDDMKKAGVKLDALAGVRREALTRAAEVWRQMLADDVERCRAFLRIRD